MSWKRNYNSNTTPYNSAAAAVPLFVPQEMSKQWAAFEKYQDKKSKYPQPVYTTERTDKVADLPYSSFSASFVERTCGNDTARTYIDITKFTHDVQNPEVLNKSGSLFIQTEAIPALIESLKRLDAYGKLRHRQQAAMSGGMCWNRFTLLFLFFLNKN